MIKKIKKNLAPIIMITIIKKYLAPRLMMKKIKNTPCTQQYHCYLKLFTKIKVQI